MNCPLLADNGIWQSVSGAGNWSDGTKWVEGEIAGGSGSTATFDGTTGRNVTIDMPVTLGEIKVSNWTSTTWKLLIGTLTLDSGINKPVIDIVGGGADSLEIGSILAGSNGFTKKGSGRLYLSGNNTFTGGVNVDAGTLWTKNAAALNGNTVRMNAGAWLISGAGSNYTSDIVMATSFSVSLSDVANSVITLSGSISDTGSSHQLTLTTNGGTGQFNLTGNNSYTGNTVIGAAHNLGYIVVRASNDNAFGQGASTVAFNTGGSKTHDNDAVELQGGITISNKTLTLRGQGRDDAGSLRSLSGDNIWAGAINTGTFSSATIGVDAGQLTASGAIAGDEMLTKVGAGTLILSHSNSFTGGINVAAGTLSVEHDDAVGGGNVEIGNGILSIAENVTLSVQDISLDSTSVLAFNLTGDFQATKIEIAGNQIGSESYTIDFYDGGGLMVGTYTLLTVGGGYAAEGFTLGQVATGFEGSTLNWNDGTLTLTVIPEPHTWGLLAFAGGVLAVYRRRKVEQSV